MLTTLTIIFEEETEILLDDGTTYQYSSQNPQTNVIGWENGTIIQVDFQYYEQYIAENGYTGLCVCVVENWKFIYTKNNKCNGKSN